MSCHIEINQNRRIFHFDSLKVFILILSRKISAKFSGIFNQLSQWRREGGGTGGTFPPETEKIVVEIWCYLPEVILSEQEQK